MTKNPKTPHRLEKGKRKGEFAELVMFYDYIHLKKMAEKENYEKAERIKWLLKKGENRQPKRKCMVCKTKTATRLSAKREKGNLKNIYFYCNGKQCRDFMKAAIFPQRMKPMKIKFSAIPKVVEKKGEQSAMGDALIKAFNLTTTLSAEEAFRFFKE